MEENMYPHASKELAKKRRDLAPEIYGAFRTFGQRVFADGALPSKTKELIAVAVAHVTQCPYCIRGHTERALKEGATEQELMEAIWVAAECAPAPPTRIRSWPLMRCIGPQRRQVRGATPYRARIKTHSFDWRLEVK